MCSDTKKLGEQVTENTTAPVSATPAHVARGVEGRFSIRRSLLYELHNGGHIKSVSLRRRGQCRGKRLFDVCSIRQFLREQMEQVIEGAIFLENLACHPAPKLL